MILICVLTFVNVIQAFAGLRRQDTYKVADWGVGGGRPPTRHYHNPHRTGRQRGVPTYLRPPVYRRGLLWEPI